MPTAPTDEPWDNEPRFNRDSSPKQVPADDILVRSASRDRCARLFASHPMLSGKRSARTESESWLPIRAYNWDCHRGNLPFRPYPTGFDAQEIPSADYAET